MASIDSVLENSEIRAALREAWLESQPGTSGGHEEGGFIVRDAAGLLRVIRWPRGVANTIEVPAHRGCRFEDSDIIASFHTHPNTGPDFLQEPSETDKRAVRDDLDLKSRGYAGELVISDALIYRVLPSGNVVVVGATKTLLAKA